MNPSRANGQPAFGCRLAGILDETDQPAGLIVLTLSADRVRGITRFLDDRVMHHFEPSPAGR